MRPTLLPCVCFPQVVRGRLPWGLRLLSWLQATLGFGRLVRRFHLVLSYHAGNRASTGRWRAPRVTSGRVARGGAAGVLARFEGETPSGTGGTPVPLSGKVSIFGTVATIKKKGLTFTDFAEPLLTLQKLNSSKSRGLVQIRGCRRAPEAGSRRGAPKSANFCCGLHAGVIMGVTLFIGPILCLLAELYHGLFGC